MLPVLLTGAHAFWPVDGIAAWWKGDSEELGTKRALEVLTNNDADYDYFEARPDSDFWPEERAAEAVYRTAAEEPNFDEFFPEDEFEQPEGRSADQELDTLLGQLETMLAEEENNPNGRSISEEDLDNIARELDMLEEKVLRDEAQPEPREVDDFWPEDEFLQAPEDEDFFEPNARSVDDFWPEENDDDFFEPKVPRGFDDEEDTLDQLEELIMSGQLSPQERAMIEEALEGELNDIEAEMEDEQAPEDEDFFEPNGRSVDDFWPEEDEFEDFEDLSMPVERGAESDLDSELDELEQMIMNNQLSREERSMIAEALEEELRDLQGDDEEDFEEDFFPEERAMEDFNEEDTLDQLEELIMSGDLSPQERAMIEEALEGELNDLQDEMEEEDDMPEGEPEERAVEDFADEEDTLDQLEELIMSGDLSPQERAMIEEALEGELNDLQAEMGDEEQEPRFVDDFWPEDQFEDDSLSNDFWPEQEPRAVDDFWPEEEAVTDFWPEEQEQFEPEPRSILDDIDSEELDGILAELEQMVEEKRAREAQDFDVQPPRNQRFAPQRAGPAARAPQEWQY